MIILELMTESIEDRLVFVDTNIILPSTSWEFYDSQLNKYREDSNNLTHNIEINTSLLKKTIWDLKFINEILSKQNASFTKGVIKQSKRKIEQICENVETRRQTHIYTQLNQLLSPGIRERDDRNYGLLIQYKNTLLNMVENIDAMKYDRPQKESYFLISSIIREIKDKFDIVKDNHEFDFGTDQEIVSSAIYESIFNNRKVSVYSNDKDISNLISTAYAVLSILRPDFENFKEMENYYTNPPKMFKVQYPSLKEREIDTINEGKEILLGLGGYTGANLEEKEKAEYKKVITSVGNFLDRIYPELVESLKDK